MDQNFTTTDDTNNNTALGIASTSLGQTFEVGLTGTLAGIEFNILKFAGTTGDLTVDIRSLTGGLPDALASNALALTSVTNSDIGTSIANPLVWTSIYVDFSFANINVVAGDMLSFVLSSSLGQEFYVQTDYTNGYLGGSRHSQNGDGNAFNSLASADLAFNSYVNVSEVPEPSIIALFAVGLFGLGFVRRRQA